MYMSDELLAIKIRNQKSSTLSPIHKLWEPSAPIVLHFFRQYKNPNAICPLTTINMYSLIVKRS